MDITGLPAANRAQRTDQVWRWEQVFWDGNLGLFVVALATAALTLYAGTFGWAVVTATAATMAVVMEKRFAVKLPHGHLGDARAPFSRGEAVLTVNVARRRVREIEASIDHHPEASIGSVGWTIISADIQSDRNPVKSA